MFTSVCLQFERTLKWKLRTNNHCLIIISQHACKLVFIPLSVYCESLILACVCYATAITGWCVLILNFCPSYFLLLFLFIFFSNVSSYFETSLQYPCESLTVKQISGRHVSHALSATLLLYSHFFSRQREHWSPQTKLKLSVTPAITAISTLNVA